MKKLIEKLKKLLGLSKNTAGFTLIELLVVIGILGVLAAALVATIDPFEQIKKANDSKIQNVAVEFMTANIRYYTSQNGFPWDATTTNGTACATALGYTVGTSTQVAPHLLSVLDTTTPTGCLSELIQTGELKPGFLSVVGVLDKIYVAETDVAQKRILVCYLPLSKAGQKDKAANWVADSNTTPTSWTQEAAGGTVCPANGANIDATHKCWWCTQ